MSKSSFKEITNIPLSNGKSLPDLLMYDNISYWDHCKDSLYSDIWKHDNDMLGILPNINLILSSKFTALFGVIDAIAKGVLSLSNQLFPTNKNNIDTENKPTIMFRSSTRRWTFSKSRNEMEVSNPYYDNIIPYLSKNFTPYVYIADIPTPSVYLTYRQMCKYYKHAITSSVSYWSFDVWKKDILSRKYFTTVWNEIKIDVAWIQKISSVLDISPELLSKKLEYLLLCTCPYYARYIFLMENMIREISPVALVTVGEQASMGMGWVLIGKKYDIPVVGLQHGVNLLEDDNLYLLRTKEEMGKTKDVLPLPDITLVWGEYDYEFFVNNAYYPPNVLKITGNQKYDALSLTTFSKNDICEKYGLNLGDKKIILWATQSHSQNADENLAYMHAVFSAVSAIDDSVLIIKPHPAEGDNTMNLFKEHQSEYPDLHVEYLPTKCNTTEIIAISDLMIMKNSTVGQDAICLDKPMVVLDFSDNPDAGNYVKDGVAAGVYQADDLGETISSLLADDTNLKNHRAEYITRYLYKLDGNSAKRCADAIMELINKNNMES